MDANSTCTDDRFCSLFLTGNTRFITQILQQPSLLASVKSVLVHCTRLLYQGLMGILIATQRVLHKHLQNVAITLKLILNQRSLWCYMFFVAVFSTC
uniref:Uncharacterized protein n=1 Tax=Pyxicephalus adspersus TaxID=30357 RepID=A0AAV3B7F1_PYXAD|nr:TPA: hypothetical protein GDO54_001443 [Pyxicephalus adspersus]